MSTLTRETGETRVRIRLDVAGEASGRIETGDAFLDHMLVTLARYGGFSLSVTAAGDLRHHLIEDVGIALGTVLRADTPERCARYGEATVPMDDALVHVAVDIGGRSYYEGPLPVRLYEHFLYSLAINAGMTLHVRVLRGTDRHHVVEAAVKALGLALRHALVATGDVFSTKGAVRVTWEEAT
jgi:imidazoleglycerol-phosphate dehydratase